MSEKISSKFLNILYPRRCPVCHDIAVPVGQKICTTCRDKLRPAKDPRCYKCSKPLSSQNREYCNDCSRPRQFDEGMGIFLYGSVLQESLFWLKYGKRQEYGTFYGQFAAFYSREKIKVWGIQVVIPIPLHRKKMEKRGYNQAALIADAMGKKLNLPVNKKILRRISDTKPQKNLGAGERKKNLRNAFRVVKPFTYKRILLVDDIYTTGATVEAAAEVLKQAGAEKVYFLTVAIGTDA